MAKFQVGEKVKIVLLLDEITNRDLIGHVGVIRRIDSMPNGETNYYVDDHCMHEAELEAT